MLQVASSSVGLQANVPRERLQHVDHAAFVEQLSRSGKLDQGCVTLIGLDAIRERLGPRWPRRQEQIWEAVERLLERRLPPGALYSRVTDVDYMLEAGPTPDAAQATSFKILRELHMFFLGEPQAAGMRVAQVLSMADGVVQSRRVEPRSFEPAARSAGAGWSALSFVAASHRMRVAFERQPIVLLSSGKAAGVRLRPVIVIDELSRSVGAGDGLTHGERLAIDQAMMLEAQSIGDGAVVAPFFFETLSNTRGRAAVLETVGGRGAPRGLVVELVGMDQGTPQSRLLEITGLLTPYCAALIARAPPGKGCLSVTAGVRLAGLSIDCEDGARIDPASRITDCRGQYGVGPLLFAFGLGSASLLPLAQAAGATHATLAVHPHG